MVSVDAMKVCPHWMVTDIPGNAVEETQAGCSPDITSPAKLNDTGEYSAGRIHDYRDLATKQAFPFPMPGINDLPECQPDMTITDMTIVGPKADKRDEYIKWMDLMDLLIVKTTVGKEVTVQLAKVVNIATTMTSTTESSTSTIAAPASIY